MDLESSKRRDDRKAASAARPRDYEYADSERDAAYLRHLDDMARCPECGEGYMQEAIRYAGEQEDWEVCPVCGHTRNRELE